MVDVQLPHVTNGYLYIAKQKPAYRRNSSEPTSGLAKQRPHTPASTSSAPAAIVPMVVAKTRTEIGARSRRPIVEPDFDRIERGSAPTSSTPPPPPATITQSRPEKAAAAQSKDPLEDVSKLPKKNEPSASRFRSQKLPAWEPIPTAKPVLILFVTVGFVLTPIGVCLLLASNQITEIVLDYTDCRSLDDNYGQRCSDTVAPPGVCKCDSQKFNVTEDISETVYIYYTLTNFYQNLRRYFKSRDDDQLRGETDIQGKYCQPFGSVRASNNQTLQYAPCGAIANSLFNDSFTLYKESSQNRSAINLSRTGIVWPADKKTRFKNPSARGGVCQLPASQDSQCWKDAFANTTQPPFWQKPVYDLDPNSATNNGYENEDLIVWMRTAALPSFRKLYGKLPDGLKKGTYVISIVYAFPTGSFNGNKGIVLSTTNWLGGKKPFFGIAYIVVGLSCFVMALVLLLIHKKYGKSVFEMADID